jgi:hypothetical protein
MVVYKVKKGAADPFRGDWYADESIFENKKAAIEYASQLTLANYNGFKNSWEEYGYEWSVFESDIFENKVWEGYKFIKLSEENENGFTILELGNI